MRSKSKRKLYKARWQRAGQPSDANVSFYATTDGDAIRQANKLDMEVGLPSSPRDIMEGGRIVQMRP